MLQTDNYNSCYFSHYIKSELNYEYGQTGTTKNLVRVFLHSSGRDY